MQMINRCKENMRRVTEYMENSCTVTAIRHGMIMMMPLLVVSSMALMVKSLPIPAYQKILPELLNGKVVEVLDFIYRGVFDFYAVMLAVTTSICYALVRRKKSQDYASMGEVIILAVITLAALAGYSGIQYDDFSISAFSNQNVFTALFISLVAGKLYYAIRSKSIFRLKRQGTNSDSIYLEAVEGILPAAMVILFFALFSQLFKIIFKVESIQELLELILNGFLAQFDNGLGAGAAVLFAIHILWSFGIHGNNVLDAVVTQNYTDIDAGIYSKTFQDIFAIMGGCGATLCLVIAIFLFSRTRSVRNIAKLALPSVIFNISEIVVFGLPVILNPVFIIPFLAVPIINCIISYIAIYIGLVPHIVNEVGWTTPVLLSGYQATGSWTGAALQVVCIAVGVVIYMPFVRIFEQQNEKRFINNVEKLVRELQWAEENKRLTALTEREDELGNVARLLAADLVEAIRQKELFLLYQPQINRDGVCIGAEALIRWKHPVAGFIYPPLIIQLAKEKKCLSRLEQYIFEESASAVSQIQQKTSMDFKISVNITNESLQWEGFEECIEASVKKYQISNDKLWLEITEQDAFSTTAEIEAMLQSLKDKGHKFLIDDFGMGHTSLIYLKTSTFDVVKLDSALTKDIVENKRNRDIIASIVYLGQSLHFITIAEFVETKEQRDILADLGCDAFQGYLYSKPISLEELIPWMEAHKE